MGGDELERKSRQVINGLWGRIPKDELDRNHVAALKTRVKFFEHREHKGRLMYDELDEFSKKLVAAYQEEQKRRLKL